MKSNWPFLSVVRLTLSFIVLQAHSGAFYERVPHGGNWGPVGAVIAFFVISGYSIAHSLQRDGDVGRFYSRRAIRIMPEVIVGWIIAVAAFAHAGPVIQTGVTAFELPETLQEMFPHLLPVWSWLFSSPSWNPALWSLGIEALYYIVAPILPRVPLRAVWGAAVASFALFCYIVVSGGRFVVNDLLCGYAYFWFWAAGYLLAVSPSNGLRLFISFGIPALWFWASDATGYPSNAALILGCAAVVHQSEIRIPERFHAAANWLGNYSYSIYALHFPMWLALFAFTPIREWWIGIPAVLVISAAICVVLDWRRNAHRNHSCKAYTSPAVSARLNSIT